MSAEEGIAMSTATKQQADEYVGLKEWVLALSLYERAVAELPDDTEYNELYAKLHANISFVCLKLNRFEDAQCHGDHAVALAPGWGKAYARLAAAQQAAGLLLDAAKSYQTALTAKDPFTGCQSVYDKLKQSKRFRKLDLIRRASMEGPLQVKNRVGQVIELPDEANDPYNAVAAMNDRQKETLAMIRAGCVLPDGSPIEQVKEQDLILYLAAIDAIIQLHVPKYRHGILRCPGTRAFMITHARRELASQLGGSDNFDIYKELLHGADERVQAKSWKHLDMSDSYRANAIVFCPNRECVDGNTWGPTVKYYDHEFKKGVEEGEQTVIVEAKFLVGLNHWLLVQGGTDPIPLDWRLLDGEFNWDGESQKLVDKKNTNRFSPLKFYMFAEKLGGYFSLQWGGEVKVPYDLYWYEDF